MNERLKKIVLEATGAEDVFEIQKIQELWSGYGEIARYGLVGSNLQSVVLKHIQLPESDSHPRGWNTDISHKRKLKSYDVEVAWYKNWSAQCKQNSYVPDCFAVDARGNETLIVLEDLCSTGFETLRTTVSLEEMQVCIRWLAYFHATYMGQRADDLWQNGSYWHLDTRPDELEALKDLPLKKAADQIDQLLRNSPFQTFVHGDAKLANLCFSADGQKVAAVDFQYVGAGCGMKDLAYFIGSCLDEEECERFVEGRLNFYFKVLQDSVKANNSEVDFIALETNWRHLFPVAWTDFHRFIKGWSPGHWKINSYSERLAREVVAAL
jgi:thiamine kinase-like enzyme